MTACPHCAQRVPSLAQHVRDTGANALRPGVCPVLHALRNLNNNT